MGAKSHRWKFTEFYSDSSRTIQFIEMVESEGVDGETQTATVPVTSNANEVILPNDLVGSTANKWMLLATQSFAELPGAVTPDFILPDRFFRVNGDVIRYNTVLDVVRLESVPTDGIHSVDREGNAAVNTPTNFAGEVGQIDLSPAAPTASNWLIPLVGVLFAVSVARGLRTRPALRNPADSG